MNTPPVGSPRDLENGRRVSFADEKLNVQTTEFKRTWFLEEIDATELPEDEKVKIASQRVFVKLVDGEEKGRLTFDNDRRLVVTLFGPPCSGKWTQSCKLEDILKIKGLFTKFLLADEMENKNSIFGQLINFWLTKKQLDVTPEIVNSGLIINQLCQEDYLPGWIIGDYPLTAEQCLNYQRGFLKNTALHLPIYLDVTEAESFARNEAKDEDDRLTEDNIRSRLEEFNQHKVEILKFPTIKVLDLTNHSEDQVHERILQILEEQFDALNQSQIQQQTDRDYVEQQPKKFAQLEKKNASLASTNRLLSIALGITALAGIAGAYIYLKDKAE